jgi:hypothetical protein
MAKKPVKSAAKKVTKPAKKLAAPPKPKAPTVNPIEKASEEALHKLKALNIEPGLQGDIQWCLGSYRHDKNPVGLYVMVERALVVFKTTLAKNPKAVPAKFIGDLEKVLKSRI